MFIDTSVCRCYYMSVRLCTGGVLVPLNELASAPRCAGLNSVLRHISRDEAVKVFIAADADEKLAAAVRNAAKEKNITVEMEGDSTQLGRACALARKTAAAAILKSRINHY